MSEQPANPDEQAVADQFNADATQKAKEFLEEGVQRAGTQVGGNNTQGEIISTGGSPLNRAARVLYGDHMTHQGDIVGITSGIEENRREFNELSTRRTELDELGIDAGGLTADQREQRDNLTWHMRISNQVKDYDYEPRLRIAKIGSKANLWDAQQHLKQNQAGYVAQAVEDANAAGHDIKIGGHEYPAQPPETPQGAEEPQNPGSA